MRPYNLLVLAQGFRTVPERLLPSFEAQLAERDEPLNAIKEHEACSVLRLVEDLQAHGATSPLHFEGFAYSFRIPQISSEFDLLKITDEAVIDIELKIEDVGEERIERQLARNRYYLAPLERTCHTFTYVANSATLYEMDGDEVLRETTVEHLARVLGSAGHAYEGRIEELFRVSNYLVSPLNDTDRFLAGSYFLTNHQAQIKASFLRACAETDQPVVYLVYGSAGTGKSLLLYDLAKSGMRGQRACVIHCGLLSEGHRLLNGSQGGFHVISAKGMERERLDGFGSILVDEAQRLWPSQLRSLVSLAVSQRMPLFLSLGRRQPMATTDASDAERIVRDLFADVSVWELSRKIRTNRELAGFVSALFGLHGPHGTARTRCVKIGAADGPEGAQALVAAYQGEGYQFIAYSDEAVGETSLDAVRVPNCPCVVEVIGQEFDRVVMVVDAHFSTGDRLYQQLLYQGLTRARERLALVVLNNDALLGRLLEILDVQGS